VGRREITNPFGGKKDGWGLIGLPWDYGLGKNCEPLLLPGWKIPKIS